MKLKFSYNKHDNYYRLHDTNYSRENNEWFSLYPKRDRPHFCFGPAGYFDNRFRIRMSLTTLLSFIAFPFTAVFLGVLYAIAVVLLATIISWGVLYIHLPIYSKIDECEYPEYGFYLYATSNKGWFTDFVICKGYKTKRWHMPWDMDWVRTSVLLKDNTWAHETKGQRQEFWKDEWVAKKWSETHPYTYTLKNGLVQNRLATITVEEREWRPRWFKWTSLFAPVVRNISIDFNEEVGERTGSWKGGTLGCGYTLLPEETPVECLRRMEKERTFR